MSAVTAEAAANHVDEAVDGDSHDFQRRLGERLRAVRKAQGLRLRDVESRSGGELKAVVIGSYERGDRAVSATRLATLADFYSVPLADLLPEDDWPRQTRVEPGPRIAVPVLRERLAADPDLAPVSRLVQHVQRLRGDYNGRVLSLRRDDLRTLSVFLGIDIEELPNWLEARGLLAHT